MSILVTLQSMFFQPPLVVQNVWISIKTCSKLQLFLYLPSQLVDQKKEVNLAGAVFMGICNLSLLSKKDVHLASVVLASDCFQGGRDIKDRY